MKLWALGEILNYNTGSASVVGTNEGWTYKQQEWSKSYLCTCLWYPVMLKKCYIVGEVNKVLLIITKTGLGLFDTVLMI